MNVPSEPTNLQAVALSSTSIRVSWAAPAQTNTVTYNYKLQFHGVGASVEHELNTPDVEYTLTHLLKFKEYSFRVMAYNRYGASASTEEVLARTYSDGEMIKSHVLVTLN